MRDALGGTVALVIIVFFIVIALGYAAFNVNYMKAFRMKDKIISTYEDYLGKCGPECEKEIREYAQEIGYALNSGDFECPNGYEHPNSSYLYCAQEIFVNTQSDGSDFLKIKGKSEGEYASDIPRKRYYKIMTKINVQIPIIENVINFRFLYISGDTAAFSERVN